MVRSPGSGAVEPAGAERHGQDDLILGLAGADVLNGLAGNDILVGGAYGPYDSGSYADNFNSSNFGNSDGRQTGDPIGMKPGWRRIIGRSDRRPNPDATTDRSLRFLLETAHRSSAASTSPERRRLR